MVLKKEHSFIPGYNKIVSMEEHEEIRLDVGLVLLKKGKIYTSSFKLERAFMLITGCVDFCWEGNIKEATRISYFDEKPTVLQVAINKEVKIKAKQDSEILVQRCINMNTFKSIFYSQNQIKEELFGDGVLDNSSKRICRTVFDGEIAPFSNMVMGEVITYPGKWSSYPPHTHPQPEIYYYRFSPSQGFGVSLLGNEATIVNEGDTSLIFPNTTHSQVTAPGYVMYYVWMISHLKNNKWVPSTRYYLEEHKWLNDKNVKIWPEKKFNK